MQGALLGAAFRHQAPVESKQGFLQLADSHVQIRQVVFSFGVEGQEVLNLPHRHFDGALLPFGPIGTQLEGCIAQTALCLGHQGLGPVAAVHLRPFAAVFGGFLFRLLEQLVDLLFAEVGTTLDRHALLAAGGAIGGGNLEQPIGIDVEGHLHLGHAPGGRRNAREAETTQRLITLRHLALPLEHMDLYGVLVGF